MHALLQKPYGKMGKFTTADHLTLQDHRIVTPPPPPKKKKKKKKLKKNRRGLMCFRNGHEVSCQFNGRSLFLWREAGEKNHSELAGNRQKPKQTEQQAIDLLS